MNKLAKSLNLVAIPTAIVLIFFALVYPSIAQAKMDKYQPDTTSFNVFDNPVTTFEAVHDAIDGAYNWKYVFAHADVDPVSHIIESTIQVTIKSRATKEVLEVVLVEGNPLMGYHIKQGEK